MSTNGVLYKWIENAKDGLRSEILDGASPEQAIIENAQSIVPCYTGDTLQAAHENLFLATHCPDNSEGQDLTPEEMININIYEYAYQELCSYWQGELEDELLDLEMEEWE